MQMHDFIMISIVVGICVFVTVYVYNRLNDSNIWVHPRVENTSLEKYTPRQVEQLYRDLNLELPEKI